MRLFHPVETVDWTRVSIVIASVTAFWTALAAIVPERYHHIGLVVLAAASSALTVLVRSNKWALREETLTEKQEEKK